ncbi:metallophosphoesterase [Lactovum odontotermitis]
MRKTLLAVFFAGIAVIVLVIGGLAFVLWPRPIPAATNESLPVVSSISAGQIPLYKIERSEKQYARDFVVSDIHGRFESLKKALKAVNFSKSDRLFVLGDTVDRGPDGYGALLYLTHTLPAEGYHVLVFMGNHEEMWLQMANNGATDGERQSNLNGQIDIYEGGAPNGWEESRKQWNALSARERAFLLNEMATGFGQPHLLITQIHGEWVTFSHTADFAKTLAEQTDKDLNWCVSMRDSQDTFQKSVAEKLGVSESELQVFIGHIGGLRFGVHPHYICLDNTNTRNFNESPGVPIYEIENGKFYQGAV